MARRYQYQESGTFATWVHLIIAVCTLACIVPALFPYFGGDAPSSPTQAIILLIVGFSIPALLYGLFGSLRTRVSSEAVEISWGMSGIIRKTVPFSEIEGMEPVTYRPLMEFGGWGIRFGSGGKRAWTVSGNQALVLHLKNETHLYLGSRHPARLEERIRSAMSMKSAGE